MKYIIDRLEEEMAVCENESREMIPIPLKELPPGAQEGDVILEQEGVFCVNVFYFLLLRLFPINDTIRKYANRLFGGLLNGTHFT